MTHATTAKSTCLLAALMLLASVLSVPASAQGTAPPAQLVKAGCVILPTMTQHLFSVKNTSLTRICQLKLTPLAGTGCPIIATTAPAGWSTVVNLDGSANWTSSSSANCVQTGTTKPNFSFSVSSPGNCCYQIDYMNAAGVILHSNTTCCNCGPISVEENTWGKVKALYQ
ncbi:MAG: hypothetical protein ACT4PE_05735 [Candidatus Eiseniibacteriota bacterium]